MALSIPTPPSPPPPLPVLPASTTGGRSLAADWTFAVGGVNSLPDTELSRITNRRVTWRLTPDNHEASFTLDAELPEFTAVSQQLGSELWVMRNGYTWYRGRVGPLSGQIDPDSHKVAFSSADDKPLFDRRFLAEGDTLVYASQDLASIAWGLIAATQAKPGGNLNIVNGGGTTGITQSSTFAVGSSISDDLAQLAGFDWDIVPKTSSALKTFQVYAPQRGLDRQVVLDYPGAIQSATYSTDPGTYANALRVTGADGLGAQNVVSPTVATDPAGRFEAQYGDPDILTLTQLAATAAAKLTEMETVTPSWTVTLEPDAWSPTDIWLGDPVILSVKSGFEQAYGSLRVVEIDLSLDDETDAATASITLGAPKPDRRWQLRKFDQRLRALEKR